jgi:hypothetical protein
MQLCSYHRRPNHDHENDNISSNSSLYQRLPASTGGMSSRRSTYWSKYLDATVRFSGKWQVY